MREDRGEKREEIFNDLEKFIDSSNNSYTEPNQSSGQHVQHTHYIPGSDTWRQMDDFLQWIFVGTSICERDSIRLTPQL
jgi:hypothetical protein